MRVRFLKYILLTVVAIVTMGCSNDLWDNGFGQGPGEAMCDAELVLNIGSAAEHTRVGIAADDTANAGDKMNNLTMLFVRADNTIEKRVDITAVGSPTGFVDSNQTEATVHLTDVERGEHTIYLLANYSLAATYTEGANVATLGLDDALLPTLTGVATPDNTAAMPLTTKLSVELKQGVNSVSAELERVYGRFGVTFFNHVVDSGYTVVVSGAELSPFNASSGYLFNHNYTVPAGNTYRAFYESASGSQRLDYGGNLTPIDTYLYETDSDANYTLSFQVGVFSGLAAGVTPTVTAGVSVDETNHNSIVVGHQYLLYNPNQGVYLYDNGSTEEDERLAVSSTVPSTNYENYLWTFSTTSGGNIQNVGTGRWISRDDASVSTSANTTDAETFTKGNSGTGTFYLRSTYRPRNNNYYHLNASGGYVTLREGTSTNSTNRAQSLWTLREMKTTASWDVPAGATLEKSATYSGDLTYINDLGSPVSLTQIKRNENLQVGVNIFYNPQTGSFEFDVVPWTEVEGDVTFD